MTMTAIRDEKSERRCSTKNIIVLSRNIGTEKKVNRGFLGAEIT